MAFNFKRFWAGINLKAKAASSADTKGDLEVIDSTGKLGYHNGSTVSPVVTESHSATLTNKTIDADANTITNIDNADIKALAAIDASKIADGSVSSAEFQYLANVTSDIQTQLNSNSTAISDHISDATDAHDASAISVAAIVNLTATDVQAALAEHQTEIENVVSDLGMHILDTTDAHDASAISVVPTGNLAAIEVQAALVELQGDIDTINTNIADDVAGPVSSVDNSLPRFDGITGKLLQGSGVTIDDTNYMEGLEGFANGLASVEAFSDSVQLYGNSIIVNGDMRYSIFDDAATTGAAATITLNGYRVRVLSNISLVSIATISGGASGTELLLINRTTNAVTITNSANLVTGTGGDLVLANDQAVLLIRDNASKWNIVGSVFKGPSTATDNQLARFDGTTGQVVQSSVAILDDAGALSGLTNLTVDNINLNGNAITAGASTFEIGTNVVLTTSNEIHNGALIHVPYNDVIATGANATVNPLFNKNVLLSNGSLTSIDMIVSDITGQELTLINRTGADVTINHDTGATAAYRILTSTGGPVILPADGAFSFVFDTNSDRWAIVGGTGSGTGGGGGVSDPDALLIQNFDTAVLGDFTQDGLELVTTDPLNGDQSAKLSHDSVLNKYFIQSVLVPPKFRGVNMTTSVVLCSTASEGNVKIDVYNANNSDLLTTQSLQTDSQAIASLVRTNSSTTVSGFSNTDINLLQVGMSVTGTGIPASTKIATISTTANTITLSAAATSTTTGTLNFSALPKTLQLGFNIPAGCTEIYYEITALPEAFAETYIDDVALRNYFLGTSVQGQTEYSIEVPVLTDTADFTPTGSWITNSTYTANYWREGEYLNVKGQIVLAGAPTSAGLTINIPSGLTIDTAKLTATLSAGDLPTLGTANFLDNGVAGYPGAVVYSSSTAIQLKYFVASATNATIATVTQAAPFTFGSGDVVYYDYQVPIVGWTATETQTFLSTDLVPARSILGNTTIDVPVLTDWASYTPTFTGFGTVSGIEAQWRRSGQDVEIRTRFISGVSTGVEARMSLPNGYTAASTATIPSLQSAGTYFNSKGAADKKGGAIFIEPSVAYITFGAFGTFGTTAIAATSKAFGTSVSESGDFTVLTVKVPVTGLTATEEIVVSGTQAALIQDADSMIRVDTANGYGSTATKIRRFSNITQSVGTDILYQDSATLGGSFTVITSGVYNLSLVADSATVSDIAGMSKNASSLTTDIQSLALTERLAMTQKGGVDETVISCSWSGYLVAGDIIRVQTRANAASTNANNNFTIAKQGSLSVASVNADQKIVIPTSELRFEGASARGAVATAIVKFDTMAKIRGDAFTVTNTTNDGTFVTMRKAGRLSINATVVLLNGRLVISRNQQTLTSIPSISSESLSTAEATGTLPVTASNTIDVLVGDIIRVSANVTPSSNIVNNLNLSFQEQSVQVSVSNTLPQFSDSDSSVRVDTANGYGSTATKIRRFSNVRDNIGVDIEYADSATNGSSFTVRESGIYEISYSDQFSSLEYLGITKNASSLTTNVNNLTAGERLSMGTSPAANVTGVASWSGYLTSGDVIRAHTSGTVSGTNPDRTTFTMSKVGKPNVTGVDVTPFVSIPQPDLSQVRFQGAAARGATATSIVQFTTQTVNLGAGLSITSNSTLGTSITALKTGKISISASLVAAISSFYITRNQATLTTVGTDAEVLAAQSIDVATNLASASVEVDCVAGDIFRVSASSTPTNGWLNVSHTALADQILTAPETFSSDTAAFTYAGSGTYTQSTLTNAPVGTYITFTYAINSNTRTQTTTRPTQTDADMNTNGVLIYTRAYNVASTALLPSVVAIQIGKGMKGKSIDLYKSAAKTTSGEIDFWYQDNTTGIGLTFKNYDEKTGILYLDAGYAISTETSRAFRFSDVTTATSGYLVINASKNPALTGMNVNRVAARGVNTAGTSIASGSTVVVTYDAAKTFDTHGALNAATGVFTAPETGYYQAIGKVKYQATGAYAIGNQIITVLFKNGVQISELDQRQVESAAAHAKSNSGSDIVLLNKGDTLDMRAFNNRTAGATLLSTSTGEVYFSISKIGN